jgi:hypothetical protein
MRRLRRPATILLLALIATPFFAGTQLLFLYLTGFTYWFRYLCAQTQDQGTCLPMSIGGSSTIDNSAVIIELALLFFMCLFISALAAWLTRTASSGLFACMIAACAGMGIGVGTIWNAWNQQGAGPFAHLGMLFFSWGVVVIFVITLAASFLGSCIGRSQHASAGAK